MRHLQPAGPVTPASGSGPSYASHGGLPPVLLNLVRRNLGWAALIYAGVYLVNIGPWLVRVATEPAARAAIGPHQWAGPPFIALSLVVWALVRRASLAPTSLIWIGLAYEVVGTLGIALGSISPYFPPLPTQQFIGLPWTCVWIVLYPMLVPCRPWQSALAGVLSTAACAAGLAIAVALAGAPAPAAPIWLGLVSMNLVCAAAAMAGAVVIFGLGRKVSEARQLGAYQLEERLGEGGMGEVWRASHRLLARPAAIKLIKPEALGGVVSHEVVAKRFEVEAQATASLQSNHSIRLFDFGTAEDGTFYYVMELLDGINLDALVERYGPLPPARVVHLLRQACASLAEAHAKGLIHRDIKPANLYLCAYGLDYDFLKVLDFGLVKDTTQGRDDTGLTGAHTPPGTPAYMPPEIALGDRRADGRADLYALGCVAYRLLTGCLVFEADSPLAMLMAHADQAPVPPSQRTPNVISADLEALVMRCLAKDKNDRPASALELAEALAKCDPGGWDQERAREWWNARMLARGR